MEINSFFDKHPYSIIKESKTSLLNKYFYELTLHHYNNCISYKKILDAIGYDSTIKKHFSEIPFLPVRLFKMFDLISVPKENLVKTMTSSGTSGQEVSKIFLDKKTSFYQSKVLTKIVSSYIGSKRTPMIIIDSPAVLKNRNMFSARGAGILGFSIFGSKKIYALDEDMNLELDLLINFIEKNQHKKIFIFGFTFMIYKYFIKALLKNGVKFNLNNAILIHGGGWKKLTNQSISSTSFRELLFQLTGIESVHDYYGMVEQTGSIYMECEYGNLHTSIFSDIIIRDPYDFSISNAGKKGIIQTLSILPSSYPGHSLLTEDEGVLLGEDNCKCGRLGKYFKILGRLKNAEIRGCSDTHE